MTGTMNRKSYQVPAVQAVALQAEAALLAGSSFNGGSMSDPSINAAAQFELDEEDFDEEFASE